MPIPPFVPMASNTACQIRSHVMSTTSVVAMDDSEVPASGCPHRHIDADDTGNMNESIHGAPPVLGFNWVSQLLIFLFVWVTAELFSLKARISSLERVQQSLSGGNGTEALEGRLRELCERVTVQEHRIANLDAVHREALQELKAKLEEERKVYDVAAERSSQLARTIGIKTDATQELAVSLAVDPSFSNADSSSHAANKARAIENSTSVLPRTSYLKRPKAHEKSTAPASSSGLAPKMSSNGRSEAKMVGQLRTTKVLANSQTNVTQPGARKMSTKGVGKENVTGGSTLTLRSSQKSQPGAGRLVSISDKIMPRTSPRGAQSGTGVPAVTRRHASILPPPPKSLASSGPSKPRVSMLPAPSKSLQAAPNVCNKRAAITGKRSLNGVKTAGSATETKQPDVVKTARIVPNTTSFLAAKSNVEQEQCSAPRLITSSSLAALDAAVEFMPLDDGDLLMRLPMLNCADNNVDWMDSNANIRSERRVESSSPFVRHSEIAHAKSNTFLPVSSSLAALDAALEMMQSDDILNCTPGSTYHDLDVGVSARKMTPVPTIIVTCADDKLPGVIIQNDLPLSSSSSLVDLDVTLRMMDCYDSILSSTPDSLWRSMDGSFSTPTKAPKTKGARLPLAATRADNTSLPDSSSLTNLDKALQMMQDSDDILMGTPGTLYRTMDDSFPNQMKAPVFPWERLRLSQEHVNASPSTSTIKPSRRL